MIKHYKAGDIISYEEDDHLILEVSNSIMGINIKKNVAWDFLATEIGYYYITTYRRLRIKRSRSIEKLGRFRSL